MSQQFARFPSLSGKTVFMTGGASGIGAEIVKAFSGQGAKVGFLDLDQTRSAELAEMLGPDVAFEICDLRDITALKLALDALTDRIGSADVVVNNAARDDRHDWQDVTVEGFRRCAVLARALIVKGNLFST